MRLFVALDISESLRARLEALRSQLLPLASLRLVDPESMHLTLKFLGEVPDAKLDKVKTALASVAFSPVKLQTTRLGTFSHVLWLGLRINKELAQLQQRVQRVVREFTTHDPRSYRPHLTLARFERLALDEQRRLERLIRTTRLNEKWKAEAFTLYNSRLTPQGPAYMPFARFPLERKNNDNIEKK